MRFLQTATAIALAILVPLLCAVPAGGATARIGAVEEFAAGDPEGTPGGSVVQLGERAGSRSYAVPPGYGVITQWSHRTGLNGGPLTFKVYRPTETASRFLTVASDARTVTAQTTHTFPVGIRVKPGDRLGLFTPDAEELEQSVNIAYVTEAGDQLSFFGNEPMTGATAAVGEGTGEYRAAVAAIVETDADGDGLGDDTQDEDDDNDGTPDSLDRSAGVAPPVGLDSDGDGISDFSEAKLKTNRLDSDTDDDGLADGAEDRDHDGVRDKRETSALKRDSDGDRLTDGVERGVRGPVADPAGAALGTDEKRFKPDRDPRSKTKPLLRDTDRDGLADGREDRNRNGRRDRRETDPRRRDSDRDRIADGRDPRPLSRRRR